MVNDRLRDINSIQPSLQETYLTSSNLARAPESSATIPPRPDFAAIKAKQQATWASGDFAVVGTTLQIVGDNPAEGG